MLGRLLFGIIKGIVVGGLIGFGLVKLGFLAPGAVVLYLAAAVTGVLIGLVAGKPIWAKDAKIEAGMKAFVGALLGAGLMFAARRWLPATLPFQIPNLTDSSAAAISTLAAIAAVLGGFYEADNTPAPEGEKAKALPAKGDAKAGTKRIASAAQTEELDELDGEADRKRAKK